MSGDARAHEGVQVESGGIAKAGEIYGEHGVALPRSAADLDQPTLEVVRLLEARGQPVQEEDQLVVMSSPLLREQRPQLIGGQTPGGGAGIDVTFNGAPHLERGPQLDRLVQLGEADVDL